MIIKTAVDYDKIKHAEQCVSMTVPDTIAEKIVQQFINKMDYKERLIWIQNNITDTTVISEEELEKWSKRYV